MGMREIEAARGRVFISYCHADRYLAERVRDRLEAVGVRCFIDWRFLEGGDPVNEGLLEAIEGARALVALLTPRSVDRKWVWWEIEQGRRLERERADGFRLIPALSGLDEAALRARDEDLAGRLRIGLDRFGRGMHELLVALDEDEPRPPPAPAPEVPRHELVLRFSAPRVVAEALPSADGADPDGATDAAHVERVHATLTIAGESGAFRAPIGRYEADALRWYLESYPMWPSDAFSARAKTIEEKLPEWGRALWDAVQVAVPGARDAVRRWIEASRDGRRALTIEAEAPDPDAARDDAARDARHGLAALFALPWELLHDRRRFLVHRNPRVAIRRRTDIDDEPPPAVNGGPVRVLVVVARPEQAGLIDPKASALGLLDAVEPLGDAVALEFLRPPTLPALARRLKNGPPVHVLHFDGHGVFDPVDGLGKLCFEHRDPEKRARGEAERVSGRALREVLVELPVPLVFLDACQTDEAGDEDRGSAVAAALLEAGAGSVVAMSHSVLVEAARRFTRALYAELCRGRTIADAVTAARTELHIEPDRGTGGVEFELQDWFVPVLLQREDDPVLLPGGVEVHADPTRKDEDAFLTHSLPPPPPHAFVGRVRELLAVERALDDHRVAVLEAVGGQGKTTLAAEAARWLFRTRRFPGGVAFASVEDVTSFPQLLARLGEAVVPGFTLAGTGEAEVRKARRALLAEAKRRPTLFVLDNFESLLPPPEDAPAAEQWTHEPALLAAVLDLAWDLSTAGDSRVVITTREPLPDRRFTARGGARVLALGGLPLREALALVGDVCRREAVHPRGDEDALRALVEAVGGHPRSLVLLPGVLRDRDAAEATRDLHAVFTDLDARLGPDVNPRERSLYASLRLSLDRLPRRFRDKLPVLGLLRAGVFDQTMGLILDLPEAERDALTDALVARALAHREGPYLRFHPALPHFLEAELRATPDVDVEAAWRRVVAAYVPLVAFLYQQRFGEQGATAVALAVRELPNLLRVLDHLAREAEASPESLDVAIGFATRLESLLQTTPHRRALNGVAKIRGDLSTRLEARSTGWTHAEHIATGAAIDRALEAGDLETALRLAERAAHRAARAAAADPQDARAAYDAAESEARWGRVLRMARLPEKALSHIEAARRRFEALAEAGNRNAARMASACLTEAGDCLVDLGRLDDAAACYEAAIEADEERGDERDVAVGKGQLATVRMLQGRLQEALDGWHEVRRAFEALGEPASVAVAWHQIGNVHLEAGDYDGAERAYKRSLALRQSLGDRPGIAATLTQLAIVARLAGRLEESVEWDRRAIREEEALRRPAEAAMNRNNLAGTLRRLGRLDEAEAEAREALEVQEALGLGGEPWKTWGILREIAADRGDAKAEAEARTAAMDWYRRWRDEGGAPQFPGGRLVEAMVAAHAAGRPVADELDALASDRSEPDWLRALATALAHYFRGDHDAARAALPDLDWDDAVELERLLDPTPPPGSSDN